MATTRTESMAEDRTGSGIPRCEVMLLRPHNQSQLAMIAPIHGGCRSGLWRNPAQQLQSIRWRNDTSVSGTSIGSNMLLPVIFPTELLMAIAKSVTCPLSLRWWIAACGPLGCITAVEWSRATSGKRLLWCSGLAEICMDNRDRADDVKYCEVTAVNNEKHIERISWLTRRRRRVHRLVLGIMRRCYQCPSPGLVGLLPGTL